MDDDEPREPSLDHPPPDYFPNSFWPPPPLPTPIPHPPLHPDHIPANYFEEEDDNDGGCMLGDFPWNLPSEDDREYQFGDLDRIGVGCSASAPASMLSSFPSTSVSVGATEEGLMVEQPDEKKSNVNPPSLDMANKVPRKGQKRIRQQRIAFMMKSEVDNLEDGYRWRKYGQKAVKNSPFPRSYYRCTNTRCTVKKRVERSPNDPAVVITTYEGQHCHHSAGFPCGGILISLDATATTGAGSSSASSHLFSHPTAISPSSQFHISPPGRPTNLQRLKSRRPPATAEERPSSNGPADGGLLGDIMVPPDALNR
ncbi:hypothetical protein MLD38_037948 [Melastoma candidum]|uniref:Uncharacterized protein n=1 Tax=Melastoma candidum TaxID=119954 RepID=A0ACB9KY84_9MYRT|nr:hypothetical protein MLD38_037948 [Melastoma candidum]